MVVIDAIRMLQIQLMIACVENVYQHFDELI